MAQIIWTEPALADVDAIADFIALENSTAAREMVARAFAHVEQLELHPDSGSWPLELGSRRYRQIVEPPCRIFYRHDRTAKAVYVVHVMRADRLLKKRKLNRK